MPLKPESRKRTLQRTTIWDSVMRPPKSDESLTCIGEEPDTGGSISLADDGKRPGCADLRKNRNKWLKRKYKLGTWNTRDMLTGKLSTIIAEANDNRVDILELAEHRWAGCGRFSTWWRKIDLLRKRKIWSKWGSTIYLSKSTAKSLIGYNPVNDRILTIRLHGQAKNITH